MNIVKFGDGFCVLKCSLSTLRAQNTHLQIILSSRSLKFSPAAIITLQLTNSEPMTFSSKLRVPHLLESLELCNKCNLTNRESLGKDTSAFPDELWGTAQDRIGHHRIQYNPMNMNPCPHVISNLVLFHSNLFLPKYQTADSLTSTFSMMVYPSSRLSPVAWSRPRCRSRQFLAVKGNPPEFEESQGSRDAFAERISEFSPRPTGIFFTGFFAINFAKFTIFEAFFVLRLSNMRRKEKYQ